MLHESTQPSDISFGGDIIVGSGVPHGPPARKPQALYIGSHRFILHPGRQDGASLTDLVKVHQSPSWCTLFFVIEFRCA